MYHLITGLHKWFTQKDEYNVIIIGLNNAGKSVFLESAKRKFIKGYKGMDVNHIPPTIGLNLAQINISKAINLKLFDLGGQKELQHLWEKYYNELHGIIYVIDSSDRSRLNECKNVFEEIMRSDKLNKIPLMIVANKQDVPGCVKMKEIEAEFESSSLNVGRKCNSFAVSGLSGLGVEDAIFWMSAAVAQHSLSKSIIEL